MNRIMRYLLPLFIIPFFCLDVLAQQQAALVSNREIVKKEDSTTEILDFRVLPLFGEIKKNQEQQKKDDVFLKNCDENFKDRTEASKFFAERGWEYIGEGQLDTAVYRFNLSYLLNPQNMEAYWGLGVVSFQKGKFEESAKLLSHGLKLDPNNAMLMVDIATVQMNCFVEKRNCEEIDDAVRLLEKSVKLDSTNANAWLKFAVAEYHQEHFDKSWEYIHKCRMLDLSFVDLNFVQQLIAKKEDPMGIFK